MTSTTDPESSNTPTSIAPAYVETIRIEASSLAEEMAKDKRLQKVHESRHRGLAEQKERNDAIDEEIRGIRRKIGEIQTRRSELYNEKVRLNAMIRRRERAKKATPGWFQRSADAIKKQEKETRKRVIARVLRKAKGNMTALLEEQRRLERLAEKAKASQ